MTGSLSEVARYDHALDAYQVEGHYRASGRRAAAGPVPPASRVVLPDPNNPNVGLGDTKVDQGVASATTSTTVTFFYCLSLFYCSLDYFPEAGATSIPYEVWQHQDGVGDAWYYAHYVGREQMTGLVTGGRSNNQPYTVLPLVNTDHYEWYHHVPPADSSCLQPADGSHCDMHTSTHRPTTFNDPSSILQGGTDVVVSGYTTVDESWWDPDVTGTLGAASLQGAFNLSSPVTYDVSWQDFGN